MLFLKIDWWHKIDTHPYAFLSFAFQKMSFLFLTLSNMHDFFKVLMELYGSESFMSAFQCIEK